MSKQRCRIRRPSGALSRHMFALIFICMLYGLAGAGTHNNGAFHIPTHDVKFVRSHSAHLTANNQQPRLSHWRNSKKVPQSWGRTLFHDKDRRLRDTFREKAWIRANIMRERNGVAVESARANRAARHFLENNATRGNRQDMEALIRFKSAISSDPLRALKSWRANDSTSCHWSGVKCTSATQNRVVSLNLQGLQLSGNINSAMSALSGISFLSSLDLSVNYFSGTLPGNRLANFSSLSYLNASFNQVNGPIPFEVQDMTNLEVLDFENNNLTGRIPAFIGNCTSLGYIDLGANLLKGAIPDELGSLSQLWYFYAGNYFPNYVWFDERTPLGNDFSGTIPSSLGNCSKLALFSVQFNPELSGPLPLELGQLQDLQIFALDYCSLTGALPSWLSNWTSLRMLGLTDNLLHGSIPKGMGQVVHLGEVYLDSLSLTGAFPADFFNCTEISILSAPDCSMTGVMPRQLGSLRNLIELSLVNNNFTGVIPSDLANCSQLEYLLLSGSPMDPQGFPTWLTSLPDLQDVALSSVNLVGRIPEDIGTLSQLYRLDLDVNNLTGGVPSSFKNCTSLETFYLSTNRLSGRMPPELGSLVNLQDFLFFGNLFSGPIPAFLGNMTQLVYLAGTDNLFQGMIGGDWNKLSQLAVVRFGGNQLSGPIPPMLNNCSSLLLLNLSHNSLSGPIPFKNSSSLEQLLLSNNNIRGEIPVGLATCSSLGILDLSVNYLEGELSSDLSRLTSLLSLNLSHNRLSTIEAGALNKYSAIGVIDLSHNHFSGAPPGESISQILTLYSFNISHNRFSGSWLREWTVSQSFLEIDISSNNISGSFPNFGNSVGLQRLDISRNHFSGTIPKYLATWSSLQVFNASYNDFKGPIPTSLERNITADSFLGMPDLCGGILGPSRQCPSQSPSSDDSCQGFVHCKRIWIPVFCVGVGLIIAAAVALILWVRSSQHHENEFDLHMDFGALLKISPTDISSIMSGENENKVIGSGAKSVVYKGSLSGGEVVAVKTFFTRDIDDGAVVGQRESGWQKRLIREATIQATLRHRNILKVLSLCSSPDVTAIVLEYMPQGSLQGHLHHSDALGGSGCCTLSWRSRFSIAFNVAEGMKYLHHDRPEPLIHGDLKPTNILLDDNLVAKIADFGISRIVHPNGEEETTASGVCGTVGYIPPEYAFATRPSTAGDVYSYGILVLELLTGRRPTASALDLDHGPKEEPNLRDWILDRFSVTASPTLAPSGVLDPTLGQESRTDFVKSQQMMLTLKIALFATRELPQSRPSMSDVLSMLTQVRDLGLDTVTRRTTAELAGENDLSSARDVTMWTGDEPNAENVPSLSY